MCDLKRDCKKADGRTLRHSNKMLPTAFASAGIVFGAIIVAVDDHDNVHFAVVIATTVAIVSAVVALARHNGIVANKLSKFKRSTFTQRIDI